MKKHNKGFCPAPRNLLTARTKTGQIMTRIMGTRTRPKPLERRKRAGVFEAADPANPLVVPSRFE